MSPPASNSATRSCRAPSKSDDAPTAVRLGWRHPRRVRRFAQRLLSQQLWCWGRDIECQSGNLLLQHGFLRCRAHVAEDSSTCYRIDDDRKHIAVWGFGVFYGERRLGGLYINRFDFHPHWAGIESLSLGIHLPDDLPVFAMPQTRSQWARAHRLCRNLLRWLEDYERWVHRHATVKFRRNCIAEWRDPVVMAEDVPSAWRMLRLRAWDQSLSSCLCMIDSMQRRCAQ